ncbi:GAF domain-containing protein [Desulfomonile tiedjei]|uniref:GAF domain-containing protein n=1 Tax=Desulfomonile tiedjei (strain ATCC 49306 / DSM 6799 / DCB-1) TaxID=706587 RepID=I4C8G4_DESTA|nr:GAF domain-containing protein [Desulfomonile tiedjei]AFM25855.1 GAF domain-containing protein [Desulfomonile tiedjei DSM 6799]
METTLRDYPFRCVLNLKPLVDFWEQCTGAGCGKDVSHSAGFREPLMQIPILLEPIENLADLEPHRQLVSYLMDAVFPRALWDTEAMAAAVPFTLSPFLASPNFEGLLLNGDRSYRGHPCLAPDEYVRKRILRAYFFILKNCYGIEEGIDIPEIHVVPDPETGLDRYFSLTLNTRFVEIHRVGAPEILTPEQRETILANLNQPEVLRQVLPPEQFEFRGFVAIKAMEVTDQKVLAALDRDLIDKDSFISEPGFARLQQRLRTLFRMPDLTSSLAACLEDRVLLLNTGCHMVCNCIFTASRHVEAEVFDGSVFDRAMENGRILRVPDLAAEASLTTVDMDLLEGGLRSLMVVPLHYQEELIGTVALGAQHPDAFRPTHEMLADQLVPRFSMALARSLDELHKNVESVIKQKCTAVHPTVEWRFRKAVLEHLESAQKGEASELEPIVFREVYPLYGTSDIRGSSHARNAGIREDMTNHLSLALAVVHAASEVRRLPILDELAFQIVAHLDRVSDTFTTGDEAAILGFIHSQVEPLFKRFRELGGRVADAIEAYRTAIDSEKGTVYNKRRDFEESVSLFNERMSAYLDAEEAEAQAIFPHYFDKHQTDGIDYVVYMGASMMETGEFDELFVRNLRIWQLMVACGLAWHTEQLNGSLKVPLETTHLILVNHNPLAIRFRFDEKRFDVDGAYNVAHEIIRSRIDKATIREGTERLTQPGKISIVYSRLEEEREMRLHVAFLQYGGFLNDDLEEMELDDLPDVKGMKALRVGVNLRSSALADRLQRVMDSLAQSAPLAITC